MAWYGTHLMYDLWYKYVARNDVLMKYKVFRYQ